jgi:hypothetical protein
VGLNILGSNQLKDAKEGKEGTNKDIAEGLKTTPEIRFSAFLFIVACFF